MSKISYSCAATLKAMKCESKSEQRQALAKLI